MVSDRLRMSLLPALQALLENVSVTRAAETMHVTQSTMSRTLSQLRGILHDPILVREGNRIFLSEKARQLQPLVDKLVADADQLFEGKLFDPQTSQHHFRISASGHFQEIFLCRTLAALKPEAPSISFSLFSNNNETLHNLENGTLDLGFLQLDGGLPSWLQGQPMIKDQVNVVLRQGHPLVINGITCFSDLDDYPYLGLKSPMHETPLASKLKSAVKSIRNPWMMIDSFSVAIEVLKYSDGFTIANPIGNNNQLIDKALAALPLPIDLPGNLFWIVWPEHWAFSQAHQWLRKQLEQSLRQFYRDAGRGSELAGLVHK